MDRHASDDGPAAGRRRGRLAGGALAVALVAAAAVLATPVGTGGPMGTDAVVPVSAGQPGTQLGEQPTQPSEPAETPSPATFSLLAAGDVLPHGPVLDSATPPDGSTDFSPLLAGLDPWVRGADLALCHLEVPVAPPGTAPSGYPVFGAPPAVVRDLAEQGWDGCSTASNHSLDRGYDGVRATLRRLDAAGMGHAGTARSAAEQDAPQLYRLQRAGRVVTVAHLAATYGLNGIPMPAGAPWAVDLIDADRLVAQARAARADGADAVLVSLHAGTEYTEDLTGQQREVVRRLARSHQVDLVIGHHAHVPQRIVRVDGGPGGDGMWAAYGLGNLLSNQSADCCDPRTSSGELLSAVLTQRVAGGPVRVSGVRWTGTTVDIPAGHRVHALPDLLAGRGGGTGLSAAELRARQDLVRSAVGDAAKQQKRPADPTGPAPQVVPRR